MPVKKTGVPVVVLVLVAGLVIILAVLSYVQIARLQDGFDATTTQNVALQNNVDQLSTKLRRICGSSKVDNANNCYTRLAPTVTPQIVNGKNGVDGAAGPQGEPGPPGPMGLTGPDGQAGAPGERGPRGLTGADGTNGTNGVDGATGATGPVGPEGPGGPQGAPGKDGADGKNGVDGTNGKDGADGKNATCPNGDAPQTTTIYAYDNPNPGPLDHPQPYAVLTC